ncbi:MAG: M67 family metallopeptidase [Candidatus Promineofilum sp.]|jgi:proteasome lid subunit RPN8/RPN11|nr:M67 family metallopeptidase [Promineifilum sp.]
MNTLIVNGVLLDEMLAHVAGLWPEEACGLVGGRDGRAVRLYPVENTRHSPVAFEMDPLQQIKAMLAMEAEGLDLIAIYHSHPDGPARPSATDVANAYYPDAVQLIISLADRARPSVRAFTIIDGVVTEVRWEENSV